MNFDPTTFDVLDQRFHVDDPWPKYDWLRENDPFFWEANNDVWVATSHRLMTDIEKSPGLFSSAQGIRYHDPTPLSLLTMDAPEHSAKRRLLSRAFTPKRINDLRETVREVTNDVLDRVEGRRDFDFVTEIAMPIPTEVIAVMLGLPRSDGEQLRVWSDTMLAADEIPDQNDSRIAAGGAAAAEWFPYIEGYIEERRARPTDDLISTLVAAVDHSVDDELAALDHGELLMFLTLLLVAGNDTTRNSMSGGVRVLTENPAQYDMLRENHELIPSAVEEVLRWVSPVLVHLRTVTATTEFAGKNIVEGQKVCVVFPAANFDPAVFDDPTRFDITRRPNEHRAFGFGPHYCLGAHLARLEMQVLLEEQLRRLPYLQASLERPVEHLDSTLVRGLISVPVTSGAS